jgi:hypothetical protein
VYISYASGANYTCCDDGVGENALRLELGSVSSVPSNKVLPAPSALPAGPIYSEFTLRNSLADGEGNLLPKLPLRIPPAPKNYFGS